ncbi:MAG: hypothetical protein ACOCVF_00550 [bacterium]
MNKDKIEKLEEYINKLDEKKNNIFFCVPDVDTPSSSVNEIYFQAKVLSDNGMSVTILTEKDNGEKSKWVDNEYEELEHLPLTSGKINISPADILVIPDVLTNIMEQTKDIPAMRIVSFQSIDYMLNSLVVGSDWSAFGIHNVLANSNIGVDFLNYYYKRNFVVKKYTVGIPDYFKSEDKIKNPVFSIVGRNSNDISKIVKLFYAKYPEYSWVAFDPLVTKTEPPQLLERKQFAERLKENFAAIWVDRISTFGTFPLECMKAKVLPIGYIPEIEPDYFSDHSQEFVDTGLWVNNIYNIPTIAAELITDFLNDNIDEKKYELMDKVSGKYNVEQSQTEVLNAFSEFMEERKEVLVKTKKELENKEKENNDGKENN